ncbi:serine hydrolase domain-containing protein [Clostridium folliculivorans]|uniref:serine hydrolase domain-containing protein n=1 Tax=Clostridium folliculivorans TaxID=2886038 RepID=UPI0021C30A8F|nr:serine hydrolase domain-containing protein [Clostridium folliculivorans]GKU30544.1 penicillin-binding protein [Clostridium folliculivorans]
MDFKFKSFLRKFLVTFVILNLAICVSVQAEVNNNDLKNFKTKLDDSVRKLLKKYDIAGTSIGLISGGKLTYVLNYGYSDKSENKLITNDTVFQVGSISKSVAAVSVMHLVQQGKLDLDAPAEKYLTRWHIPDSKYNKSDVTIRRLLSHTAGISIRGYRGIDPDKKLQSLEESLSDGVKIAVKPGSQYRYSGGGYTILQLIMEEVTKTPFYQYANEEILNPLGMKNSSYDAEYFPKSMSKAYSFFGEKIPTYKYTEATAAGLKTTVSDFSKFMLACMDGGDGIISKENLDTMFTPVKSDYGFGFAKEILSDGTTAISHGGANRGWEAQFEMIPEKKDGIIIFTNSDNGVDIINDVLNQWKGYETGKIQPVLDTYKNIQLVVFVALIAVIILSVILMVALYGSVRHGKRGFAKIKAKFMIRLGTEMVILLAWILIFYAFRAALLAPYAVRMFTYAVFILIVINLIYGLFPKTKLIT